MSSRQPPPPSSSGSRVRDVDAAREADISVHDEHLR
jgi:hypothetical protein